MSKQGTPIWYELMTPDPAAAQRFYENVLGWKVADSGMAGMDYRLASAGDAMVAGLMAPPREGIPANWGIYFAVADCDAAARDAQSAGASICVPATDIPGVGRFAVLTDPQGAVFNILKGEGSDSQAFDQSKPGHGNWQELMTTDPKAALSFYGKLFGWSEARVHDMGAMGGYHIISHDGREIGGMMGLGGAPMACWLPYFGSSGIDASTKRIAAAGGKVIRGPMEVPGGAFIVVATDPQGAHFAIVGPKG